MRPGILHVPDLMNARAATLSVKNMTLVLAHAGAQRLAANTADMVSLQFICQLKT